MGMKRKIYSKLLDWKKDANGSSALLIEGARRIGKSTICQEFAKNEYKSHIIIDFAKHDNNVEGYFQKYLNDLDTFFMLLSTYYGVSLEPRNSVIVFDEVQMFPRARAAIKYLVEDGRYDYIETGSLISIRENVKDIVIPSEEQSIRMYPMDFEEFLWAMDEEPLINYIKKCFVEKNPLDPLLHKKSMLLFKQYLLVGGMPKPLDAYIKNNKNFEIADKEKRKILILYRNDIMKINARYRSKVISIYDQIPGLLSKHEKRVVFNNMKQNSRAEQYAETFFWLSNSMITNECFLCTDPNVGFALNQNNSYIKCYMADTGLLVSHAFNENEITSNKLYSEILNDNLSLNEGMLYENMIAQMLTAAGHKLYFYTHYSASKHRNDIEVDFMISNKSKVNHKISPIEVKSNSKYSVKSLNRFNEKFAKRIDTSYIIHPKNLVSIDNTLRIPPYMTMLL